VTATKIDQTREANWRFDAADSLTNRPLNLTDSLREMQGDRSGTARYCREEGGLA
jgi:hypothetical protein